MATDKKMGRPKGTSDYPNKEQIKSQLVSWIADGKTLREFCRQEGMPHNTVMYDWEHEDADFALRIVRAREHGADCIAEESLKIADTLHMGEKRTVSSGGDDDDETMSITTEDMLGHRKLQIETRLKLLAKWNPRKYGDKVTMAGDDANPIVVEASFDIFGELLKNMTLKRQAGE